MGSNSQGYDNTVTVKFEGVAVVKADRFKTEKLQYTNLRCDSCQEWWVMMCLGNKPSVICPWCGSKLEVKLLWEDEHEKIGRVQQH